MVDEEKQLRDSKVLRFESQIRAKEKRKAVRGLKRSRHPELSSYVTFQDDKSLIDRRCSNLFLAAPNTPLAAIFAAFYLTLLALFAVIAR